MVVVWCLLLVVAAVCLFWPYRVWPVSGHFGLFSIWTLFRDRAPYLPKKLILKNFSLSRIFMHYIVELTASLFGKENLGRKVMYFQFASIGLCGIVLFCLELIDFHLPPFLAFLGAFLFLFVASRPQFIPDYSNAEPFYVVFSSIAMGILCFGLETPGTNAMGVFGFALVFVFAALNAKIHFVIEPVALCLLYAAARGGRVDIFAAFAAGVFVAVAVFWLLMRDDIRKETVGWLRNLVQYNKTVSDFSAKGLVEGFRSRYHDSLCRSPLAGFVCLGLAATLFAPWDTATLLLLGWLAVSVLTITMQGRFELYHFIPLFPPLTLLSGRGLAAAAALHPAVALVLVLFFCLLARRSMRDFFIFYSRKKPLTALLALATDVYPYYWETRFAPVIAQAKAQPGTVLAWGITPEFYFLADMPPVTSVTYIHRQIDYLQPDWKTVLQHDVIALPPAWIYDFNCWNIVYGRLNPLGFYFGTGLVYQAARRRENIVSYRLLGRTEMTGASTRPPLAFNAYGTTTLVRSMLDTALEQAGYDLAALPGSWSLDIDELVAALARGERRNLPPLAGEEAALWQQYPRELALFRIVVLLHRQEEATARALYDDLAASRDDLRALSCFVAVLLDCLGRLLHAADGAVTVDPERMHSQPVVDLFHTTYLLMALAKTEFLSGAEKEAVFASLGHLHLDGGAYRDAGVILLEQHLDAMRRTSRRDFFDTGNSVYLRNISSLLFGVHNFVPLLQSACRPSRGDRFRVVLYGLTEECELVIVATAGQVDVVAVADTFKHGKVPVFRGIPVIDPATVNDGLCDAVFLMMTIEASILGAKARLRQSGFSKPVLRHRSDGGWRLADD